MKIDDGDLFSDAQAITASAKSTHNLDLRAARFIGIPQLFLIAQVVVAFTDAGSDSTVTVAIESDDNSAMSTPVARQSCGIFAAVSAIGARLGNGAVPISFAVVPAGERYIQLDYVVTNGNLTTGSITAWLTADPQLWNAYPQGSTGPAFS